MRYLVTSSLFLLLAVQGISQSLSPEVVASAGDQFSNATISLEWTLGELMTETIEDGNVLTQGFHQPQIAITSIDDAEELMKIVSVGPNPTEGRIQVRSDHNLTIHLLDMKGSLLLTRETNQHDTDIDLSQFPNGMYLMQVRTQSSRSMTLKILKQ